ncbi:MAG: response regulator transcription factor [Chitinophagales bacterium]
MAQNNHTTILIADDHPLIVSGLEKELVVHQNIQIIGQANDGIAAWQQIQSRKPNIAILDIQMPGMSGLEIAEEAYKNELPTSIILLTMFYELSFFEKAKQLNVKGYLLKDVVLDELMPCINAVVSGKTYLSKSLEKIQIENEAKLGPIKLLTRMEKKVFQLIGEGLTSKKIAELLFISPRTVENHRYNICKKLELEGDVNSLYRYAVSLKQ